MPVETFQAGRPVLPRGWLAAHRISWPSIRLGNPSRSRSRTARFGRCEKLEPGQTATLVSRPGRGIVQWLKLQTDAALLANDDLWLEVLVDGESEPAIAAPARYFFPSLIGGSNHDNHYNFLAVFREGFTSMLAMPFAEESSSGCATPAKTPWSRGRHAFGDRRRCRPWPKENLQIDKRLRLRGQFHRASDIGSGSTGKGAAAGSAWFRSRPTEIRRGSRRYGRRSRVARLDRRRPGRHLGNHGRREGFLSPRKRPSVMAWPGAIGSLHPSPLSSRSSSRPPGRLATACRWSMCGKSPRARPASPGHPLRQLRQKLGP